MHDDDEQLFNERTAAFFAGRALDRDDDDFEAHASNRAAILHDEVMAAMDDIDNLEPPADLPMQSAEDDPLPEKIYDPVIPTRIEKAVAKRQEIERQLAELPEGDNDRRVMLERALAKAAKRVASEIERDGTDTGRKQNSIDLWRATDGKEEYNAGRRDRPEPNVMGLAGEEKEAHQRATNAKRAQAYRARKREAANASK